MGAGVGKSGSPMPKLMISTPRAMAACFILSIAANRYGGKVLMRVATSMGKPTIIQTSPFCPKPSTSTTEPSRLLQEYGANQCQKHQKKAKAGVYLTKVLLAG